MKTEKVEFRNSKGQKLIGMLHVPEGKGTFPTVVHCHGFGSSKESSKAVVLSETLPKKEILFFRFDLFGCGESEGEFEDGTLTEYIDDLKSAIDYVESLDIVNSNKIAVTCHSLGGIVSLHEVIKDNRVKYLVLLSPVSIFPYARFKDPEVIKRWKETGYYTKHSKKQGDLKLRYQFYEDALNYTDYSVYEKLDIPIMILNGTKDEWIPMEAIEELMKHLKDAKLIILEDADHNYTKQEDYDKMIQDTVGFLEEHLK